MIGNEPPEPNGPLGLKPIERTVLRINIKDHPDFMGLNIMQQRGAEWAIKLLQLAVLTRDIDPVRIRRIMDFGAGMGGPTFALARFAEAIVQDCQVEAIDDSDANRILLDANILPSERVYEGDGVAFLDDKSAHQKYDLITAFMLGPDFSQSGDMIIRDLARVSGNALRDGGNLMMTSDTETFASAKNFFDSRGIPTVFYPESVRGDTIEHPQMLLIPKESCLQVSTDVG